MTAAGFGEEGNRRERVKAGGGHNQQNFEQSK